MATLYVTEYQYLGQNSNSGPQCPHEPPLVDQTVAIGVSSATSAAFNSKTRLVRLHTDSACSISFGSAPTATAANARMAANQTEYRSVPEGGGFKVAVITNT